MTPEGRVKELVKAVLKETGAYKFMPVQNGMGEPGLDFYCCFRGWFIAIETKAPGKVPTPRQEDTIRRIRDAGGIVFVIDGPAGVSELRQLLSTLEYAHP